MPACVWVCLYTLCRCVSMHAYVCSWMCIHVHPSIYASIHTNTRTRADILRYNPHTYIHRCSRERQLISSVFIGAERYFSIRVRCPLPLAQAPFHDWPPISFCSARHTLWPQRPPRPPMFYVAKSVRSCIQNNTCKWIHVNRHTARHIVTYRRVNTCRQSCMRRHVTTHDNLLQFVPHFIMSTN